MRKPDAETLAWHRRAITGDDHGPFVRRALRAISGWVDGGQLGGESVEMVEMTRYTGGRF